jgi:hypothetical protein
LFDLIKLWVPECQPENTNVHLARWNGKEDPYDTNLDGTFEERQRWHSRNYLPRPFVVSLIQHPRGSIRYVFAGIYRNRGKTWYEAIPDEAAHFLYDLERMPTADEWVGRLYVRSLYSGRHSRPTGKRLSGELIVEELQLERGTRTPFKDYNQVDITMAELDHIVTHDLESWRNALSSVKGIYLITDKNGQLYVGKADGAHGIWGRWTTYALTTHGNNVALMKEFGLAAPPERKYDLRFSILEIAPKNVVDLDDREKHWKAVLGSRVHGYNRN